MSNPKVDRMFGWTMGSASVGHRKVELNLRQTTRMTDDDTPFLVIIKVQVDGYVPERVEPRARVGPKIFTARLPAKWSSSVN